MPCFQAERTSSQEYRWNSTSWPEGVPRNKNGSSTAKAAAAIERSGVHVRLTRRSPNCTAGDVAPSDCPDFPMVASFAYQPPCGDTYPPSGVKLRPSERRYKPYIVVLLVRLGTLPATQLPGRFAIGNLTGPEA